MCFLATPFLFNNLYFDWRITPDQSQYLAITNMISGTAQYMIGLKQLSLVIFSFSPLLV